MSKNFNKLIDFVVVINIFCLIGIIIYNLFIPISLYQNILIYGKLSCIGLDTIVLFYNNYNSKGLTNPLSRKEIFCYNLRDPEIFFVIISRTLSLLIVISILLLWIDIICFD